MIWELNSDRPVYLQLVEQLQLGVICGELAPGSRVPPVRELAASAAVNPNTMQRALAELESTGLMQTQRTSGRCVTTDTALIMAAKNDLAQRQLDFFIEQMRRLGYSAPELIQLIEQRLSPAALAAHFTKEETDGTDS